MQQNWQNLERMLEEIDSFQDQTEGLLSNIRRIEGLIRSGEAFVESERRGLSKEALAKQTLFEYTQGEETCSVCLSNPQKGDRVYKLQCNHTFH